MTKYIKTKDGKFAGSIGEGKNKVPKPAPGVSMIAGHLDPSHGRGQMTAMAAGWQQVKVHEEVNNGFITIDKYLSGEFDEQYMRSRIERYTQMSQHLEKENQFRQANTMAVLAHYSKTAIWARTNNDSQTPGDDAVYVELDLQAMFEDTMKMSETAAWDDLSAIDADGRPVAVRSIEAYSKYGK